MSEDGHPEYIVTTPGDGPPNVGVAAAAAADPNAGAVQSPQIRPPTFSALQQQQQFSAMRLASAKSVSSSSSVRTITQNVRSHSLQSSHSSSSMVATESSSTSSTSSVAQRQHSTTSATTTLGAAEGLQHQFGSVSASNLPQQQQQQHLFKSTSSIAAASSLATSSTTTVVKGKFQSFLQQPDTQSVHPHGAMHMSSTTPTIGTTIMGGGISSGAQTNVHHHHPHHRRQFVRSTSAHSESAGNSGAASGTATSTSGTDSSSTETLVEKFNRSASAQIDDYTTDPSALHHQQHQQHVAITEQLVQQQQYHQQQQQHHHLSTKSIHHRIGSSVQSSKSAETMTMDSRTSGSVGSATLRSQLNLSGGFLAPPSNRKLTILSPIHAPASLSDMLKRHAMGRSPLSPRIGFPGSELDLFP